MADAGDSGPLDSYAYVFGSGRPQLSTFAGTAAAAHDKSMATIEDRVSRLEDAIVQIAALQDPAMLAYPRQGNDPRTRAVKAAARRLADIAAAIERE